MKGLLLFCAAGLLASSSLIAQDYAPVNWKFSEMEEGSAESIFIKEMGATTWNCKAPFRLADDGNGGIGLSCNVGGDLTGPGSDTYENVTDADKAVLEEFYKAARIVNGGSENLLCLVGKNATVDYPGAVKNIKLLPAATLFWLSGTDMPLASNYRLTIDYRVIAQADANISLTIATSAYDGIDNGTDLGTGYRTYDLPVVKDYNDYWNRGTLDFIVNDNTDENYKELPIVIKMWLGGSLYDNSVILFRSLKLEKIDEINMDNVPGQVTDPGFVDEPSAIEENFSNSTIVFSENGTISVIDPSAPIEVYNANGVLVKRIENNSTLVNIPMEESGLFIVKSGDTVKKVIL